MGAERPSPTLPYATRPSYYTRGALKRGVGAARPSPMRPSATGDGAERPSPMRGALKTGGGCRASIAHAWSPKNGGWCRASIAHAWSPKNGGWVQSFHLYLYRFYYTHWSRELVSPVCEIFIVLSSTQVSIVLFNCSCRSESS